MIAFSKRGPSTYGIIDAIQIDDGPPLLNFFFTHFSIHSNFSTSPTRKSTYPTG